MRLSNLFVSLYSLVGTCVPESRPCTIFFSMPKLSKLLCRCLCTSQRLPPPGGGVPSTCSSSASPSLVSLPQPASTMEQSGLTGDGGCPWDWLLSQQPSLEWAPCSCQTPPTPSSSVARLRKGARCWRATEVSNCCYHSCTAHSAVCMACLSVFLCLCLCLCL